MLDNGRLTAIGVLVTFVLLVQFGSFLSDLEERSRRGVEGPEPSLWRALVFEPRRLLEVFVDFVLICASFLAAYLLAVGGTGTEFERSVYLSALPILLAARYVLFVALGVYRRVWRYATARDVVPIAVGCFGLGGRAYVDPRRAAPDRVVPGAADLRRSTPILCTVLVGASRLTLRLLPETLGHRGERRRVLDRRRRARGARPGTRAPRGSRRTRRRLPRRQPARAAAADPRDQRRRQPRRGRSRDRERTRATRCSSTIPAAPQERLDARGPARPRRAGIPCRIVRRHVELPRPSRSRPHERERRRSDAAAEPAPTSSRASSPRCRSSSCTSALAALYAWQASRRPVPTIFTDELELTQLARAIAETGEPARRGEPYGLASLAAYVLAPVWWLGSATASWAAAKLILVLAMTATVFPAYGLARMVVPRWYALGAAGARRRRARAGVLARSSSRSPSRTRSRRSRSG